MCPKCPSCGGRCSYPHGSDQDAWLSAVLPDKTTFHRCYSGHDYLQNFDGQIFKTYDELEQAAHKEKIRKELEDLDFVNKKKLELLKEQMQARADLKAIQNVVDKKYDEEKSFIKEDPAPRAINLDEN